MKGASRKRKLLKYAVVALALIFLVACALVFIELWERQRGVFPEEDTAEGTLSVDGREYRLKDGIETFLVLGLDKFDGAEMADSYNNDKQSDFIMLLVFDNRERTCMAVNISRDTMANVNVLGVAGNRVDTLKKQIALAHTYGNGRDVSCRNVADSVSDLLLGVKVDHYASITLDSVTVLNDLVGGVEVTVLDDFTGIDDTLKVGESVLLTGDHALNYVRTRYGLDDSTNSNRMKRQEQYVNALYAKFKDCAEEDDGFIVSAATELSDHMISDRSVTQLEELAKKIEEYGFRGIVSVEGESRMGEEYVEFYPDEESLKKLVADVFYEPVA